MTATPEAPTAPFGTKIAEAAGADFLSAMRRQLEATDSEVEVAEPPDSTAKPVAKPESPPPVKPPAAKPPVTALAEDADIPPEIKSEKARDGWKTVKRDRDEARKQNEEYKAKLADLEKKLAERPASEVPEEFNQRLAALQKESDDLSERLRVSDVERHPKFQQYFEGKTTALTDAAKQIVGTEHAPKLERILKVMDDDQRTQLLDDLMGELTPARSARLGAVVADLEMLQRERASEIGKARERWGQLQQQTQAEREAAIRQREVLADRLVTAAAELEAFKPGDGSDAARASEITIYKNFVRQAITGKLEGQDEQMMPLMAVEGLHLKTKVLPSLMSQLADAKKQLAEFQAAQPRAGGSSGSDTAGSHPKSFLEIMSGRA